MDYFKLEKERLLRYYREKYSDKEDLYLSQFFSDDAFENDLEFLKKKFS